MNSFPQKDWKYLQSIKQEMIDRTCEHIFLKVEALAIARKGNEHRSYRDLWVLLKKEDTKIIEMFDNLTKNQAIYKIVNQVRHGALSQDQLSKFTEETQDQVNYILQIQRR
jgi:hypothetical protein